MAQFDTGRVVMLYVLAERCDEMLRFVRNTAYEPTRATEMLVALVDKEFTPLPRPKYDSANTGALIAVTQTVELGRRSSAAFDMLGAISKRSALNLLGLAKRARTGLFDNELHVREWALWLQLWSTRVRCMRELGVSLVPGEM